VDGKAKSKTKDKENDQTTGDQSTYVNDVPKLTDEKLAILISMKLKNTKHKEIAQVLDIDVKHVGEIWKGLDDAKKKHSHGNDENKEQKSPQKSDQQSSHSKAETVSVKVKIPGPDKHFDRADVRWHFH
jgi:hypothetical protein